MSLFMGDGLHTGTWGDLPNETKLAEVNEPGFVLTEFPDKVFISSILSHN